MAVRGLTQGEPMKTRILLTLFGVAALATAVAAQDRVVTRTTKVGKGTVTTFETVRPPAGLPPILKGDKVKPDPDKKVDLGTAWAKAVVLDARDWVCGRCFTDEFGRRF